MIDIDKMKEIFKEEGYRFIPSTVYFPNQFHKIFVYQSGIKFALTWWFETIDCHKYGSKDTYYCHMIIGGRTTIEFRSDVLDIKAMEEKAKKIFNTNLFEPLQLYHNELLI